MKDGDAELLPIAAVTELVDRIPSADTKKMLYHFLNSFDLRQVEDLRQLAGAMQALTSLAIHIGPHDKDYRDSFNLARQCIDSYGKLMLGFMNREFPAKVRKMLGEIMDLLKPELSEETYRQVQQIISRELGQ